MQTVYWVSNSLLGIKQFTGYQSLDSNELLHLNFFNIVCPYDILIRDFIGSPSMLIWDFIVSYTSWFWILPQFFRNLTGTFLSRYMLYPEFKLFYGCKTDNLWKQFSCCSYHCFEFYSCSWITFVFYGSFNSDFWH